MNFIKVKDNLLTKQECIEAIDWSYKNKVLKPDLNKDRYTGYDYCDLMDKGEDYIKCFSPSSLRPVYRAIETLKDSYVESFPEATHISPWGVQYVRLKKWSPDHHYSVWHSEHVDREPYRVISFLIYLSDNDSYTEFRRHRNVRTKAGRGIMFPAYFTHEHRGSVCKMGLDRYIVSGYFTFKYRNG